MTNDSETTGEDVCACCHLRTKHDYGNGECYLSGCKCRSFEKAHTPTYDEREPNIKKLANLLLESVAAQGMRIVPASPEPQGEPTDAEVTAALHALYAVQHPHSAPGELADYGDEVVTAVRAALRAAAAVREEGQG